MTEDLIFARWLQSLDSEMAETVIVQRAAVESLQSAKAQLVFLPRAYLELSVGDFNGAAGLELSSQHISDDLDRIQAAHSTA